MGACMDKPKKGKRTVNPVVFKPSDTVTPTRSALKQSQMKQVQESIYLRHKKLSLNELLFSHRIESTLDLSSKMEGPKYIANIVDGSSKVLRVYNEHEIDPKRMEIYRRNLGFDLYQLEEDTLVTLQDYASGPSFIDLCLQFLESNPEDSQPLKEEVLSMARQINRIIAKFHQHNTYLGNLNFSSFRKKSDFTSQVVLVDFNVHLHSHGNDLKKMGFAHKESLSTDNEFLGYVVQFLYCDDPPVFILHKLQYLEDDRVPYSRLIQKLLKGKKPEEQEVEKVLQNRKEGFSINERVLYGYLFRRDINKLLRMRRKRKMHNRKLYGADFNEVLQGERFAEDTIYRLEADRIFERISQYLLKVDKQSEQGFQNYSSNYEHLRNLKEVFLITEKDKKITQLKECISTIK